MNAKVVSLSPVVHLQAPDPLTPEQADVWASVVGARSADYFGEDAVPLLEEYCRVVTMCRFLAVQVEAATAGGEVADLKVLLDMRDKEAKRMASLATKLRLTNQSRYTPQAAATASRKGAGGKVWQFGQKTGA